jgi:hypothetical protein
MNIQDKMQEIHHKYGVSEKANYEIQLFVEYLIKKDRAEQLNLSGVSQQRELLAISCLNNIIQPIDYLKQLAELNGGKLDGSFAVHLTKQGMFYQELAKKAIKEIDNCG